MNFQAGHIKSEYSGGSVSVANLRPVCKRCNTSVGVYNMDVIKRAMEIIPPTKNESNINNINNMNNMDDDDEPPMYEPPMYEPPNKKNQIKQIYVKPISVENMFIENIPLDNMFSKRVIDEPKNNFQKQNNYTCIGGCNRFPVAGMMACREYQVFGGCIAGLKNNSLKMNKFMYNPKK
jgi:hypothetical protein